MSLRVRAAGLTAFAVLWLAVGTARAFAVENETFGLTPQPERIARSDRRTFGIPLEPGSVFEDAVRVYNKTDQPLDLRIYAADAEAGSDGTISIGFRGARLKGVGKWIDLSKTEVNLPPRGEAIVSFRIQVHSADPSPDLGAIVAENRARGLNADLSSRLHLVVRTSPPNSPTTSIRVRPLMLRSPWIIVAILGLIIALTIIWLGARRSRRPKDALVAADHFETPEPEPDETPNASRPVLRRLGESQPTRPIPDRKQHAAEVLAARQATRPSRARTPAARRPHAETRERSDSRPLVDDMLDEVERQEKVAPAARRPAQRKAKSRAASEEKRNFIPLDEL